MGKHPKRIPARQEGQRRRKHKPMPDAGPAEPAEPIPSLDYETNVAPALIEEERSPDRSDVLESECSLPAEKVAGRSD